MKIILAILSCHRDREWEQAQRDTWIKDIPEGIYYAFFLGNPAAVMGPDEVFLEVPDDSLGLPYKTRALAKWAMAFGYDFVFKCDIDTLLVPENILGSGFEKHDYLGGQNSFFASGGSGYWLSRKSMAHVAAGNPAGFGPAEDVFVARTLGNFGIGVEHDPRYRYYPGAVLEESTISYHLSSCKDFTAKYEPSMMYQAYADRKSGVYRTYR